MSGQDAAQDTAFPLFHPREDSGWCRVAARRVYDSPHLQVEETRYLTPGRGDKPVDWTVALRKAAVAVAPVLPNGNLILISQERLPVQDTLWEFPAGQIDDESAADPRAAILATARAELREEAGVELLPGGTLEPLGWFLNSPGFTTEHAYLFRACPVRIAGAPEPDHNEHIPAVIQVSPDELRSMIDNNEITNSPTLALFARMSARGLL
jgi:ADP-ribose pyrophosphatase